MHFKDETRFVWTTTGCVITKQYNHFHFHTVPNYCSVQCMLLESWEWDALFFSLKVRIPSGREYCIEPREYRKINFHQYRLEIVNFFFIKLLIHFKFYVHNLFHLDNPDPVEEKTISNPNPKNSQYPAGLDSKVSILYTTGRCVQTPFDTSVPMRCRVIATVGSLRSCLRLV